MESSFRYRRSLYLGHKNIYFKKSQTITAESKLAPVNTIDIKGDSTINFAPHFFCRLSHAIMRPAPGSVRGA